MYAENNKVLLADLGGKNINDWRQCGQLTDFMPVYNYRAKLSSNLDKTQPTTTQVAENQHVFVLALLALVIIIKHERVTALKKVIV